jgi:glutaredoxin-related protein
MTTHHEVVIVGAGLAGLTAARYLQRAGIQILLLEGADRVGGRVTSDLVDGFILDRGFQVINPAYPEVQALKVLDNLEFKSINPAIRYSREVGDLIVGDPRNSLRHLGSLLSRSSGATSQKLAFLRFLASPQEAGKTFGEVSQTFPNFAKHILNPFLQGVLLNDPRLFSAEVVREIVKYFVKGTPGIPAHGVLEFSNALAAPVVNIKLNQVVQEISNKSIRTNDEEFTADYLVVATDSTTATHLLNLVGTPKISSSTTWYHSTSEKLLNSKYLVVDETAVIANSIVISEVSSEYAPNGVNLLATTTIDPVSEVDIRRSLAKLWCADTRHWNLVAKYEIKQALPLHTKFPTAPIDLGDGIFVVGDYRGLPSQQGAMNSGKLAAEIIIRRVQPKLLSHEDNQK